MTVSNNIVVLNTYKNSFLSFGKKHDPINKDTEVDLKKIDTIGWALGGGGARGVFEIGCACALTKAGLTPDVITGYSAGSICASMLGDGDINKLTGVFSNLKSSDVRRIKIFENVKSAVAQAVKFIFPFKCLETSHNITSAMDLNPLVKFLKKNLNTNFKTELMINTTNVNTGKQHPFATPKLFKGLQKQGRYKEGLTELNEKNIYEAVRASCSISGIFPVTQIGNKTLFDGYHGNVLPATNGVDALVAVNKDLQEGLLFVVSLEPRKTPEINAKNANAIDVGFKTIDITFANQGENDIKMAKTINKELKKWGIANIHINNAVQSLEDTANNLKQTATRLIEQANGTKNKKQAAQLTQIAKELEKLGLQNETDAASISKTLSEYKPFKGRKHVKVILIRPQTPTGIELLDFNKLQSKSDEVIKLGYNVTLDTLLQTKVIDQQTYNKLKQEPPYPVKNMFEDRDLSLTG